MIVIPPWGKSIVNSETKATEYTKSYSFIYQRKKPVDRSIYCLKKGLSDINVTVMPKSGRQTDISTTLKKEKKWGIVCLICMNC